MQCNTMQCIPLHCTTLHCLDAAGATQIAHNAMYSVYIALGTTQCIQPMYIANVATGIIPKSIRNSPQKPMKTNRPKTPRKVHFRNALQQICENGCFVSRALNSCHGLFFIKNQNATKPLHFVRF